MRACLAGEVLHADFSTDDDDIFKAAKWKVMDKTTVRGLFEFDQSILEKLNNARELYLDFSLSSSAAGRRVLSLRHLAARTAAVLKTDRSLRGNQNADGKSEVVRSEKGVWLYRP